MTAIIPKASFPEQYVAIPFEERDLMKLRGDDDRSYASALPMRPHRATGTLLRAAMRELSVRGAE